MKGLTPAEYELLAGVVARMAAGIPPHYVERSGPQHELRLELEAQGRLVRGPPRLPGAAGGWSITAAGREAVRLWPLVREFFGSAATAPQGAP